MKGHGDQERFLRDWKKVDITPIFKKGRSWDPENYSLTEGDGPNNLETFFKSIKIKKGIGVVSMDLGKGSHA